jgi:ATP-dependent exoDNAse (exonuclease V) beta subunit
MLLMSGCMKLTNGNRPSGLGEWLDWLAGPLGLKGKTIPHQETGQNVLRIDLWAGETPVACAIYEPECSWDRVVAAQPPADVSPATSDLPLLAPCGPQAGAVEDVPEATDLGRRVWQVVPDKARAHAPHWVVGRLVHEALAAWRFPEAGFETWAEARARTLGLVDRDALQDAATQSARLLQRFSRHELFLEMGNAEQRLSEVPYSLRGENGRTDNGVVDALYRRAGQWTIVEFKTDHVADAAGMRELLKEQGYLRQAERYVWAVEQLLGEKPRHVFCWLDYEGRIVSESKE